MAIYLIDYENVYIEGLNGLEQLTAEDEIVIFYTQNRCGLTFELHRRLIACRATLRLMEVTALSTRKNTVKNALDLQLSMYIGYLIGSRPNEMLYIISKDTDFDLNIAFFSQYLQAGDMSLFLSATIENALNGMAEALPELPEIVEEAEAENENVMAYPMALQERVQDILGIDNSDTVNQICIMLTVAEDLLTLNNLLAQHYHDGQRVKEVYHKLKPSFAALRDVAVGE